MCKWVGMPVIRRSGPILPIHKRLRSHRAYIHFQIRFKMEHPLLSGSPPPPPCWERACEAGRVGRNHGPRARASSAGAALTSAPTLKQISHFETDLQRIWMIPDSLLARHNELQSCCACVLWKIRFKVGHSFQGRSGPRTLPRPAVSTEFELGGGERKRARRPPIGHL